MAHVMLKIKLGPGPESHYTFIFWTIFRMTDHSAMNTSTWLSQVMHAAVKKSTCVVMSRDIQILSSDCVLEWKQFAHFFSEFSPATVNITYKESFDRIRYICGSKLREGKKEFHIICTYLLDGS